MKRVMMLCDSCAVRFISAGKAVPHSRDPAREGGGVNIRYHRMTCDNCFRDEDCSRTTVEVEEPK